MLICRGVDGSAYDVYNKSQLTSETTKSKRTEPSPPHHPNQQFFSRYHPKSYHASSETCGLSISNRWSNSFSTSKIGLNRSFFWFSIHYRMVCLPLIAYARWWCCGHWSVWLVCSSGCSWWFANRLVGLMSWFNVRNKIHTKYLSSDLFMCIFQSYQL